MSGNGKNPHRVRILLTSLLLCEAAVLGAFWAKGMLPFSATIFLTQIHPDPWVTIESDEMENGATVPANTNVIFHPPVDMPDIFRETMLGNRGKEVRYWGYCFPDDYDFNNPKQSYGLPGRVFLSEAERAVREKNKLMHAPRYSLFRPPTREDLLRDEQEAKDDEHGTIRHQMEIFRGGQTCYIMTEAPLPIGTDRDDDGLSSELEMQYGTDPNNADTDGDTLSDGVEVFNVHTDPLQTDTDGDGLTDGVETHSHTRLMEGDTNPLDPDSDHDGLCDGLCKVNGNMEYCTTLNADELKCANAEDHMAGEDKDLSGTMEDGETDPLKWSTPGDGISDLQHYYKCMLENGTNC